MSRLQALERQLLPKKQESQPQSDLGSAIEQLIEERVNQRVQAALDTAPDRLPPRLQQVLPGPSRPTFTRFDQVPSPPRVAPPLDLTVQVGRDELGRINVVNVGNLVFHVQRAADGRVSRLVPSDLGTRPTPGVPPAPLNGG